MVQEVESRASFHLNFEPDFICINLVQMNRYTKGSNNTVPRKQRCRRGMCCCERVETAIGY